MAGATQRQTESYLKPLLRKLKHKVMLRDGKVQYYIFISKKLPNVFAVGHQALTLVRTQSASWNNSDSR